MQTGDVFDVVLIPDERKKQPVPMPFPLPFNKFDSKRSRDPQLALETVTAAYVLIKVLEWASVPLTDGATLPLTLSH